MRELIERLETNEGMMRNVSGDAEGMIRKGDILLAQALGHLWKAANAITVANDPDFNKLNKKIADAVNTISKFLKNSDPFYEKEILKIARKVEKRGSKTEGLEEGFTGDESEADELVMYAQNDSNLYRQRIVPILKNMVTKKGQGKLDRKLLPKMMMYLVNDAADKYAREFGSPGQKGKAMFTKKVRDMAAERLADEYYQEVMGGEHDEYLPKKYQK
jgi:hypothetical protein